MTKQEDPLDDCNEDATPLLLVNKDNDTATTLKGVGMTNGETCQEDVLLSTGYKYDHGNSILEEIGREEEDEEQHSPYDPENDVHSSSTSVNNSNNQHNNLWMQRQYTTVITKNQQRRQIPWLYLLGSILHPVHDYQRRKIYEKSLFWFTYRYDFHEIKPYQITTDAGWGCMLRSAQMLLAHALRIHFSQSSKHWLCTSHSTNAGNSSNDTNEFNKRLLSWFLDYPSTTQCFYSLHNMCAAGLAKHQVLPGEWYGPGTACFVLRDLVAMHQEQQPTTKLFRIHVATEGTVYRQLVEDLMTRDGREQLKRRREQQQQHEEKETTTASKHVTTTPNGPDRHPLDPLSTSTTSQAPSISATPSFSMEWDTSLLLLVPLRLGLNSFHPDYVASLARTFALEQSVGVLGGRPRGARWFFGAYADGSKILGLDPHTVQPAVQKLLSAANATSSVSDEFLQSVHTTYPETIGLIHMDPSIALGFYCRSRKDLQSLEESLKQISTVAAAENKKRETSSSSLSHPELVTFMEHAPQYYDNDTMTDDEAVVAAMMNDVMLQDDALDGGRCNTHQPKTSANYYQNNDDDDDDYVLL